MPYCHSLGSLSMPINVSKAVGQPYSRKDEAYLNSNCWKK